MPRLLLDSHAPATTSRQPSPAWAARLGTVAGLLAMPLEAGQRARLRGEAWLLLTSGLMRCLRRHAAGGLVASREDLQDLASEKALELLIRAEHGRWDPASHDPWEIVGFLSAVARNGLVDLLRRRRHLHPSPRPCGTAPEGPLDPDRLPGHDDPVEICDARVAARTLCDCLEGLAPRARRIWTLRVLHEMPSRQIARHPAVQLRPEHVDVILMRARQALRRCLQSKGVHHASLSRDAVLEVWERLQGASEQAEMLR